MDAKLKKLLEMAGTLDHHVKEEKKLFDEVCSALSKLEKFCKKQHEAKVYNPLADCAGQLCQKLTKHLGRYK